MRKRDYTEHIKCLKRVRNQLKASGNAYVCILIKEQWEDGLTPEDVSTYLRNWINKMLNGATTLDDWLYRLDIDCYDSLQSKKLCATRIAWVTWMIEELERP